MESLRFCTFTGADENTDVDRMITMSAENPQIEWGILFSGQHQAEDKGAGRYPRTDWIDRFLDKADAAAEQGIRVNRAIHFCGPDAVDVIKGNVQLKKLASRFDRMQLNVRAKGDRFHKDIEPFTFERAVHNFAISDRTKVILPRNAHNEALFQAARYATDIEFLYDSSGGRGLEVRDWPRLDGQENHGTRLGHAGGLGPDNIAAELPRLSAAAGERAYWIDMESKLRVNDRFSLDVCERVIKQVSEFMIQRGLDRYQALGEEACSVTNTEDLSGFWLDWYAGVACGLQIVVPPLDAYSPTYLFARHGTFHSFQPTEIPNDLNRLIEHCEVGVIMRDGEWVGITPDGQEIKGASRTDTAIKAVVLDCFGYSVPKNPVKSKQLQRVWLGEKFASAYQLGLKAPIKSSAC
jgi:phosphoribosylanthranilate isomerase